MNALHDKRRPGGRRSVELTGEVDATVNRGSRLVPSPLHVFAVAFCTMGHRGILMQTWLVRRCPYCSHPHRHEAKPGDEQGTRLASCKQGHYLVHAVTA